MDKNSLRSVILSPKESYFPFLPSNFFSTFSIRGNQSRLFRRFGSNREPEISHGERSSWAVKYVFHNGCRAIIGSKEDEQLLWKLIAKPDQFSKRKRMHFKTASGTISHFPKSKVSSAYLQVDNRVRPPSRPLIHLKYPSLLTFLIITFKASATRIKRNEDGGPPV